MIAAKGLYLPGIYRRNYTALIKAVTLSEIFLLLIAFLYEADGYVSRSSFLISWLLSVTFTCTGRLIFDFSTKLLRKKGAICYPIFVITDPEDRDDYVKFIQKENCYTLEGLVDSESLDRENREATFEFLKRQGIVETFVSWNAIKNRLYICWHFQTAGITLRILPTTDRIYHPKSTLWKIGNIPCLTIPAPIIAGSDFWIKRCFDLCCSIVLLMLFSPLYLLIALLIKLDSPGPIFFRQERIGLHCKKFKIWKFRTMVTNAEKLQANLEAINEIKDGVFFTHIIIDENAYIAPYVTISGTGNIKIGKNCLIAPHCGIFANNHIFADPTIPIEEQGITRQGIVIEDECWLGHNVTVLDGVIIGKGSIIGAASVVNKNIPPFSITVGTPARIIKNRLDRETANFSSQAS